MSSKRDIRRFFSRYYLILIVLPLIITGVIITLQTYRASLVDIRELQRSHALVTSARISDHFSALIDELVDAVNFQNLGNQTSQEQFAALNILLFSQRSILRANIYDSSGRETLSITSRHYLNIDLPQQSVNISAFPEEVTSENVQVSNLIFHGSPAQPYFTISVPIVDESDQQIIHVLSALVGFMDVDQILDGVVIKDSGFAYLINDEGRLISSSRHPESSIGRLVLGEPADENELEGPLDILRKLINSDPIRAGQSFSIAGRVFYVVTELPIGEAFFLTGNVMLIIGALILFVLLTSVIFQGILKQQVIRPVERLYNAAVSVAEGDLSQRVEVSGTDQVKTLSEEFNAMVMKLESMLEQEKDRSHELEALNTALQEEIDERQRAETALDQIFSLSQDLIGIATFAGKFEMVNPAFVNVLGYSEASLKSKDITQLVHKEERDKIRGLLRELSEGRSLAKIETRVETAEGVTLWFALNAQRMDLEKKIFVVARDITSLKADEQRLQELLEAIAQSNKELERFAYIVSHDLQEPLRKIQAFGERLRDRLAGDLDEKGSHYLDRMSTSAARLQHLIDDLLTYSRVSTQEFERVPVDLDEIINEALSDLVVQLEETQGKIEVGELPTVVGNATLLRLLFQNLISNGLKFHRPDVPPVIHVWCEKTDGHYSGALIYRIKVEDNGIGFEQGQAEYIFDVFKRLHDRESYEGTGIGLAICKKIVENHGGRISAQGNAGEGALFEIELPAPSAKSRGENQHWSAS